MEMEIAILGFLSYSTMTFSKPMTKKTAKILKETGFLV